MALIVVVNSVLSKILPGNATVKDKVYAIFIITSCFLFLILGIIRWIFGNVVMYAMGITIFYLIGRWFYWNGKGALGWNSKWLRNPTIQQQKLISIPPQETTLRVVCISDTHGKHKELARNFSIPNGDILIHCGDFTDKGTHEEIQDFNSWLGTLPHKYKVVIAGNHDVSMDAMEYARQWKTAFRHTKFADPNISYSLLTNAIYLENRSIMIEGIKIYGSPMTQLFSPHHGAFPLPAGFAAKQHWAKLPGDIDILITHAPPNGILDRTITSIRAGDVQLLKEIVSRVRPKFHLFGHIHEGYGITTIGSTVFMNCSSMTFTQEPLHEPLIFDIPKK